MKHKHHIVPKHAGGTDEPSNLVELTVDEHAEAHRKLYEQYGRKGDYIAWKALSGQISKTEAQRLAVKHRDTSYMKTKEWSQMMSSKVKKAWQEGKMDDRKQPSGWSFSDEQKEKMRLAWKRQVEKAKANDWHRK